MSTVILSMSMSLDGFVTGPDDDLALLHDWMHWGQGAAGKAHRAALEVLSAAAAMVMGRRMFDLGNERNGWLDNPPFPVPIFVPSHSVPSHSGAEQAKADGTGFTFVTDGAVNAIRQAQAIAGDGLVVIAGGANVIQQALNAGLVDELRLHLVPVVLGAGIRLFDNVTGPVRLEVGEIGQTPEVTHLTYRVRRDGD